MSDSSTGRGPFPILPDHHWGLLVDRDEQRMVLWSNDGVVEPAEPGSADDRALLELGLVAIALAVPGTKASNVVERLGELGFTVVGDRRFNMRSGELFQDACVELAECHRAGQRRRAVLEAHDGRHPPLAHDDWEEWEAVTRRMNASAKAVRVLGVASLEAFVNEVMSKDFPADYALLEEKQRAAPMTKLRKLCELLEVPSDARWLTCLGEHMQPRRTIVHHRPGYVDDYSDPSSVGPSPVTDPNAVLEFVACLQRMFHAVFAAYDLPVPSTHQPYEGWDLPPEGDDGVTE